MSDELETEPEALEEDAPPPLDPERAARREAAMGHIRRFGGPAIAPLIWDAIEKRAG